MKNRALPLLFTIHLIFGLSFLNPFLSCLKAQDILSKGDVFKEICLAKNPGDNFQQVSGLKIKLDSTKNYNLQVVFGTPLASENDSEPIEGSRRVILSKWKGEKVDCKRFECWLKLHQFSDNSSQSEHTISSLKEIFITFWRTNNTLMTRGGFVGNSSKIEEVQINGKKGIKIDYGFATSVILLPL